jgi:hypothetical protein
LFVQEAEAVEEGAGVRFGLCAILLQGLAWGEGDVAQDRHVGEEVEGLVDDADAATDAVRVDALGGDLLSFHHDAA